MCSERKFCDTMLFKRITTKYSDPTYSVIWFIEKKKKIKTLKVEEHTVKVWIRWKNSSGSRNFGEGGPRNMKCKPPHLAAIFFLPIFTRQGGHDGPPAPLDPLLKKYPIYEMKTAIDSFKTQESLTLHNLWGVMWLAPRYISAPLFWALL